MKKKILNLDILHKNRFPSLYMMKNENMNEMMMIVIRNFKFFKKESTK